MIYFKFIFSLWCSCKGSTRNTQCLQNSAESTGRSALTLGSLCLLCRVRDTVYSSFFFYNNLLIYDSILKYRIFFHNVAILIDSSKEDLFIFINLYVDVFVVQQRTALM